MSEIITTYLLSDLDEPIPMDRDEFYAEQVAFTQTGKKPIRSVALSQVLLFTSDGDIILQKRSSQKAHNANLIDKTMGGHITYGDSPDFTVMAETLQELSVPSFVIRSNENYKKTLKLLQSFLTTSALVQFIESRTAPLKKRIGGADIEVQNTYYFYLGIYNGPMRPADKEAAGLLFYSYTTLPDEMAKYPDMFTDDLRFFLSEYSGNIDEFLLSTKEILSSHT